MLRQNKIELRLHQLEAKNRILEALENQEKRILVNAPCSWGKTKLVADLCHYWTQVEKKKVLFVVPYQTLVQQAKIELRDGAGLGVGIIAGGFKHSNWKTQVASIQALTRRNKNGKLDWFKPDIVVLDEAHETAFSSWVKSKFPVLLEGHEVTRKDDLLFLYEVLGASINSSWKGLKAWWKEVKNSEGYNTPEKKTAWAYLKKYSSVIERQPLCLDSNLKLLTPNTVSLIGLTGSPWRLKKTEFMGDFFSHLINCETPGDLLDKGWTTPINYYQIKKPKIEGVRLTSTGDYNQKQLSVKVSDPKAITDIVSKYKSLCPTRKFICFAVDINHAKLLTEEFTEQGVNAELIQGNMPYRDRKPLFDRLGDLSDPLQGLVSVGCLSVGFNVPEVSCIIGCRPTKSLSLHIQQVSRGIRLSEGKEDCVYIDQSGNLEKFGFLENLTYPKDINDNTFILDETPTKVCPECGRVASSFEVNCTCGYHFPDERVEGEKRIPVGDLVIILKENEKPIYDQYRHLLKRAYQLEYNPSWAQMQCAKKFDGKFPRKIWGRGAIFSEKTDNFLQTQYWNHLQKLKDKLAERQENSPPKRKTKFDDDWCQRWFKIEFGFKYDTNRVIKIKGRPAVDPMQLDLFYADEF
ncbi:DEAD/DEAH box helicase family protein [Crocosphaera sp.]|uniref:DEAD/DEAH box helicase n=1 Tax=Crocosphaera sp. TaxID=2729996 RepID=UPI002602A3FD|nr:DEAD/DEAH box helicase family protein [Crocosphaera sp.]MDJ0579108.1 DEAD/DEAH box helicase family protein [Crocosphaera sp.]